LVGIQVDTRVVAGRLATVATVLVVDDDESVARLVAKIVEFCRHYPIVEDDPFEAAQILRAHKIGAVLTDYMMPKLDGLELLTIAQESSPQTRRVLITAAPNEEAVKAAAKSGLVQMVIAKPPGIAEVEQALAWLP
jgi:DNA-binding NtrC family response regulator